MIIAPPLDPTGEAPKAIQMEAGGLIEKVLDVGHEIHGAVLFEGQSFLLMGEEVFEELLLDPHPFCFLKGGNAEFVIDLKDMLQVLPPTTAVKLCRQPCGIMEGGPWLTSPLGLGSFRCWWWWWGTRHQPGGQIALLAWQLHTCLAQYTSWVTDGSATMSLPSRCRPSMVLCVGAAHGGSFTCGGVRDDSPPCGLLWWLYCLLVGRG